MTFPKTSAELVKNTSTVSPTTLPTVKEALDNLQGRAPTSLPVPITEGGTGQTTANAAFNALSPTTTRGDLIYRNATVNARLPIGSVGRALYSDGTDPQWATIANILGVVLTSRGQIIRRGASAVEALAAQTADTFLGGDGTDVTTRTAAQVRSSLTLVTGSYTPTLTNVANLSASTAFTTYYMRLNNIVTVAGKFQADAVAAASTNTQMGMSLPIASALTADSQLGGAAIQASGRQPIELLGDPTNDRANFFWLSQSTANENISFIFQYVIL